MLMEQLDFDDINFFYRTTYHILSYLESAENQRFAQEIIGEIIQWNEEQQSETIIGRIKAYKLLLGLAAENGWDALSIFDAEQLTLNIGEDIYDFQTDTWDQNILKFYDYDLDGSDVLIGARIEILPAYRGQGISKKAIRDLYNNFISGCALFVIKCFPLQSEALIEPRSEPFAVSMCYDQMERDHKKAFGKLSAFYKSVGFQTIPKLNKDIMLINPLKQNKKFEAIELD